MGVRQYRLRSNYEPNRTWSNLSLAMRMLFAIALLLISTATWAQDDLGPQGPVVKMAPAPVVTAVQGKAAVVPLMFRVTPGYHINSNQPKSEFLIPTALKVEATTDIVIGKTTYPDGQDTSFPFDPDEKLNVYTGDFKIDVLVRPLHTVQPGKYIVRATLKYQACDNAACYPPKQLPVSFDVKIAKAPPAPTKNPAQSPHAHQ
jgi:Disulphide bond corrector protein DsbC